MTIRPLRVFVSHATEERKLAQALTGLLQTFSQGVVSAWFSSDDRPGGGLEAGLAWRAALTEELAAADAVLAVQSPLSLGRPWIMWECALASSTAHALGDDAGPRIIPITYGLGPGDLTNPLDLYQGYAGADRANVEELCRRLGKTAGLTLSDIALQEALDTYLLDRLYRRRSPRRSRTRRRRSRRLRPWSRPVTRS